MTPPHVGSVVHYQDSRAPIRDSCTGWCQAAIVTEIVPGTHTVSLTVFGAVKQFIVYDVHPPHMDACDVTDHPASWHWPEGTRERLEEKGW